MKYRPLGRSGLIVSEVCFGTMTFGGSGIWQAIGTQAQDTADSLIRRCVDAGVNFIDTADIYSSGWSEEILGAFRGFLGDKLSLSSEALTFRDVESRLREKGVTDEQLAVAKDLFTAGEASRFAGGGGSDDAAELRRKATGLAKELEKTL